MPIPAAVCSTREIVELALVLVLNLKVELFFCLRGPFCLAILHFCVLANDTRDDGCNFKLGSSILIICLEFFSA